MLQFSVSKSELLEKLGLLQGITTKQSSLATTSHVLFSSKNNELLISGSNIEMYVQYKLDCVVKDGGEVFVPSKKLYEIVKVLPDETIRIKEKDNFRVELTCGKAKFNIIGLSPNEQFEFPDINSHGTLVIKQDILSDMIKKTAFSASVSPVRNLNAIYMVGICEDGNSVLRMVATDSMRLALVDYPLQNLSGIANGIMLPKKNMVELKKLLDADELHDTIEICCNEDYAEFKTADYVIKIKSLYGTFPDYTYVLKNIPNKKLVVNRMAFHDVIKRLLALAPYEVWNVVFDIDANVVTASTSHPEYGDATEQIDVQYDGQKLTMAFNAKFLLETIQSIVTDEVVMLLHDAYTACAFTPTSCEPFSKHINVIMPLRP